jgi:hypothetical protein
MHGPINVKSPNNISKWQMEFNSAFKGLMSFLSSKTVGVSGFFLAFTVLKTLEYLRGNWMAYGVT